MFEKQTSPGVHRSIDGPSLRKVQVFSKKWNEQTSRHEDNKTSKGSKIIGLSDMEDMVLEALKTQSQPPGTLSRGK